MDKLYNFKTVTYDKDGNRLLVYDYFKDEIFNIQTGEVIKWNLHNFSTLH